MSGRFDSGSAYLTPPSALEPMVLLNQVQSAECKVKTAAHSTLALV
jgi:hypothetical protein